MSSRAQHWFTATPDPSRSVFKPFSFQTGGSPHTAAAPAPRNPPHALWQAWQGVYEVCGAAKPSFSALRELEHRGLKEDGGLTFAAAVEEELGLYRAAR